MKLWLGVAGHQLACLWVIAASMMSLGWLWQRSRANAGIVDVLWAGGLGVSAILFAALGDGAAWPRVILGVLGGLWGARLATHLWTRVRGEPEDGRYRRLRARRRGDQFKFFLFFQLQALLILLFSLPFVAVARNPRESGLPPIKPVASIDLSRFMGEWYVIATIPTRFEKNAYNAVETYTLRADGDVDTRFRFRNGAFDRPVKTIHSTGYVKQGTGNAVWGVQVFWPIKAQYIVAYLKEDYSETIVARDARDYVWVMARTPAVSQADYDALLLRVVGLGYPVANIRKVPQAWPESSP